MDRVDDLDAERLQAFDQTQSCFGTLLHCR